MNDVREEACRNRPACCSLQANPSQQPDNCLEDSDNAVGNTAHALCKIPFPQNTSSPCLMGWIKCNLHEKGSFWHVFFPAQSCTKQRSSTRDIRRSGSDSGKARYVASGVWCGWGQDMRTRRSEVRTSFF